MSEGVGGWRFLRPAKPYAERIFYSDLSVTSWQLLFLRSARNAGFDVPPERIESALTYIKRCFHDGTFHYVFQVTRPPSRAMAGAGILSLSLAGEHNNEAARAAADWILENSFRPYRNSIQEHDRYFYSMFYCA